MLTQCSKDLWLNANKILAKALKKQEEEEEEKKKKKKYTTCTPVCDLNAETILVQQEQIVLLERTLWALDMSCFKSRKKTEINLQIKRRSHGNLQRKKL